MPQFRKQKAGEDEQAADHGAQNGGDDAGKPADHPERHSELRLAPLHPVGGNGILDALEPLIDALEPLIDALELSVDALEPFVDAVELLVNAVESVGDFGADRIEGSTDCGERLVDAPRAR
ncbi:MAG: hypothetical protein OXH09_22775 [Gammaproteobacteria bacterium]|nr:hypothetical protein [Gammaproteobacteria bacterium]